MNPEKILYRKSATKAELRRALAQALGVPCPSFVKPTANVHTACRRAFVEVYERHTGMDYSWQAKDAGCLNGIIKKLYSIAKNTDDRQIIHAFEYLVSHLPGWYLEHGLSLCVVNAKFNEIIAEIKKHGKGNVSDSYKRGILEDLRS